MHLSYLRPKISLADVKPTFDKTGINKSLSTKVDRDGVIIALLFYTDLFISCRENCWGEYKYSKIIVCSFTRSYILTLGLLTFISPMVHAKPLNLKHC